MQPQPDATDIDALLLDLLEDDVLAILLTPPRVPSFLTETVRPEATS